MHPAVANVSDDVHIDTDACVPGPSAVSNCSTDTVKNFLQDSTTSSLIYNLNSFYGFEKEASGLTSETSSFLCHVHDISRSEAIGSSVDGMIELVMAKDVGVSGCCSAEWHLGKPSLSQVSQLYFSNAVCQKEPDTCSATAEIVIEPHPSLPALMLENLPGCLCLSIETCMYCSEDSVGMASPASFSSSLSSSPPSLIHSPEIPEYRRDLWAHMCKIKQASFARCSQGTKRKEQDVVAMFSRLEIENPVDNLELSFKKMKMVGQSPVEKRRCVGKSLPTLPPAAVGDASTTSYGNGEPAFSPTSQGLIMHDHAARNSTEHAQ